MNQKTFSALCLVALSSLGVACTENAGDDASTEDALNATPAGVPGTILPPQPVDVSSGRFTLTRSLDAPDVGSVTSLDIQSQPGGRGIASLRTSWTTPPSVPAGLPEGEPIVAPSPFPGRVYQLTAQNTMCGKLYSGSSSFGPSASVKIFDYRTSSSPCPALMASAIVVAETINGVTTEWYGKLPVTAVFTPDATKLVAHTGGGGFTPPPPPGSECTIGAQDYKLDLASRRVTWEVCEFHDWSKPFTKATGSRVLTRAELATVVAAAGAVKPSTIQVCGADKPYLTISVTTPSGTTTYHDDFYSCSGAGPFVDNIDGVFGAFRSVLELGPG